MDLTELRKEIDSVDEELIPLLVRRMKLSEQVAEYKLGNGIPVMNGEREREILAKVAERSGDTGDAVKAVYAAILEASRALQQTLIGG